jgi:prevent-host-death family protein
MTMVIDHGQILDMMQVMATEIKASEFKATCLALLDEVAQTRTEYIVTKYGRPVARLVPLDAGSSVHGSVSFPDPSDDLLSAGEEWNAETGGPAGV